MDGEMDRWIAGNWNHGWVDGYNEGYVEGGI